jgi:hypothetical protein
MITGFLIERQSPLGTRPVWWSSTSYCGRDWVVDSWAATRFDTQEAAQQALVELAARDPWWKSAKVVDHQWGP